MRHRSTVKNMYNIKERNPRDHNTKCKHAFGNTSQIFMGCRAAFS